MIERAGPLILVVGLAAAMAGAVLPSRIAVAIVALVVGALALVPVGRLSAVDFLYSFTGPLSAASLVLMAIGCAGVIWRDTDVAAMTGVAVLAAIVLVLAVPLYAAVIAGLPADPYRWGFGGWVVPAILAVALALGYGFGAVSVAAWVVVAGALYFTGAYTSRNLIDYLVDPVAVIFAIVFLVQASLARASA